MQILIEVPGFRVIEATDEAEWGQACNIAIRQFERRCPLSQSLPKHRCHLFTILDPEAHATVAPLRFVAK